MRLGPLAVPGVNRWLEPAFALAIAGGLVWAMGYLYVYRNLPQPFFYDPTDTWMDWFNTSYWAHDHGAYDSWQSIYPPLSFIFLRVFSTPGCAQLSNNAARSCDWVGVGALHGFYILNVILIVLAYLRIDRRTALPRSIALGAGLPMLYGLDRGNLVIVCFTAFVLAYGPLVQSARLRWLAAALAINFKVYLVASLVPFIVRGRWLWFEGAVLATSLVYLVTWGLIGSGSIGQIIDNIGGFTGTYQAIGILDLWYAGTFGPALSLLQGGGFPITAALGSDLTASLETLLPLLMHIGQGMIVMAFVAAWVRPEVAPTLRLVTLGVALALITSEAGGYTQTMILFGVFAEPWRGPARKIAILAAYVLCLPFDIVFFPIPSVLLDSYLGGQPTLGDFGAAYGPFVRPALLIVIAVALSSATIAAVWRDVRLRAWRGSARLHVGGDEGIPKGAASAIGRR